MTKALPMLLMVTVLASIFFYLVPQVDLAVSSLFVKNGTFLLEKGTNGAIVTDIFHYGMRLVFFAYMAVGGLALTFGALKPWFSWRKYLFVILSVSLAAGLMTNVVFKDHWGRARPAQIVQFGGSKRFTPAWVVSDQCDTNCSFVGGDVSFAFCALSVALLNQRKRLWTIAVVCFGGLITLCRIAAGGHFLSDCLLAALLTSLVILQLYKVIKPV